MSNLSVNFSSSHSRTTTSPLTGSLEQKIATLKTDVASYKKEVEQIKTDAALSFGDKNRMLNELNSKIIRTNKKIDRLLEQQRDKDKVHSDIQTREQGEIDATPKSVEYINLYI